MIRIDRLAVRLPAGFEQRAPAIAREFAVALTALDGVASRSLDQLVIAPVRAEPGQTDAALGASLARAVRDALMTAER